MRDQNSKKYIIIVVISVITIISLLLFGIIYSFSNRGDVGINKSVREEQREEISKELTQALNKKEGYIDQPIESEEDIAPYWEKERRPITKVRAESLVDTALKEIGSFDFSEAQKSVDKVLSEYDPSDSDIYNNNADLFLDLVIMSNYNDLYGIDDENIISQIKNCKDERVILASTLRLEPNLYQYVIQSPDSILPVVGDKINFGELIVLGEEDEKNNILESIIPFAEKYTVLIFESDNIIYKAFFAHTNETVRLVYIIDEPETGRLNTIQEWSEFFGRFEENMKED